MPDPRDVVAAVDVGGTRVKAALVARPMDVIAELTAPTHTTSTRLSEQRSPSWWPDSYPPRPPELVPSGWRVAASSFRAWSMRKPVWGGSRSTCAGAICRSATPSPHGPACRLSSDMTSEPAYSPRPGWAQRGVRNAVFIAIGTGIAGALMLDGAIVSADGWAGELGHVVVDREGPLCACGQRGCLETISSAASVERRYAAEVEHRCRPRRSRCALRPGSGSSSRVGSRGRRARFRCRHDCHPDRGRVGAPRRRPRPKRRHTPHATTRRCQ